MEDVFSAGGLDRYLRMVLFLQNATTGDLKAMADRCREEEPELLPEPNDPEHLVRCHFPVGTAAAVPAHDTGVILEGAAEEEAN